MVWEAGVVRELQNSLCARETVESFRVEARDFTRTRQLGFTLVVLLILRGHKQALQTTLNKLFTALGLVPQVPTASALCQARQKIKPALFLHLTQQLTDAFYLLPTVECDSLTSRHAPTPTPNDEVLPTLRWRSHRVLGIDGTTWDVPNTPQNQEHYGCATNQHAGFVCAQALPARRPKAHSSTMCSTTLGCTGPSSRCKARSSCSFLITSNTRTRAMCW